MPEWERGGTPVELFQSASRTARVDGSQGGPADQKAMRPFAPTMRRCETSRAMGEAPSRPRAGRAGTGEKTYEIRDQWFG